MEHLPIVELYRQFIDVVPERIIPLDPHASNRKLYRLQHGQRSVIGVINADVRENAAFIYFTKHFKKTFEEVITPASKDRTRVRVPEVYKVSDDGTSYLEEDLGDITLLDFLNQRRTLTDPFPEEVEIRYEEALRGLVTLQFNGFEGLDLSYCQIEPVFTSQSMLRDMKYFEESFLTYFLPNYSAENLQREFNTLVTFLAECETEFFMFRDFQSRNIMVTGDTLAFIDYQGGRAGPLLYDVISLLYQSSAKIPQSARDRLTTFYLHEVQLRAAALGKVIDVKKLPEYLDGFTALRMLQVLGTYGKQGISFGKEYFLKSIPAALTCAATSLKQMKSRTQVACPYLIGYIEEVENHERFKIKS